tara:strand:+ start:295 stop:474 length:180 start_codon:yes stop_codon:yes gene_type:complete
MIRKLITTDFKDYELNIKFIESNSKYKLVSEQFIYNSGGWVAPLPKLSNKQIINYIELV